MKSLGKKPAGARLERIKASPLWVGDRFRNVQPVIPGLRDPNASMPTLGEFLCGGERRVPRGPLPSMNPLETWARPPASGLRATWLGHSTVLIEVEGLRVLTDPVWGPHAVFFSGDTGLTTEYQAIRERLGPFDLVMLEVGAFHPAWGDIHLGPQNALKALALLGGGPFLPVHWGTFSLAMHAWDQPAERLLELAPKTNAQLVMPRLGEPVEPAHAEGVTPWWRVVDAAASGPEPEPAPDTTLPDVMSWP